MRESCDRHRTGAMLLIPRLSKQIVRRTTPETLGVDLRLLIALSYLRDHEDAPQQELADALCVDASNVVLLLNELEDLGYVERRRDREDRRRHRVSITAAGRKAFDRAEAAQQRIEDRVLQALDEHERELLRELLQRALRGAEPGEDVPAQAAAAAA